VSVSSVLSDVVSTAYVNSVMKLKKVKFMGMEEMTNACKILVGRSKGKRRYLLIFMVYSIMLLVPTVMNSRSVNEE
jgi:hypothetical protein